MSSPKVESIRSSVHTVFSLAHLLEHIERSGGPIDADQYQKVVAKLKDALAGTVPEVALAAVLRTYPSVAELHGNLNHEAAGLCRSWLHSNVPSEVIAAQLLRRVSRRRA